MKANTVMKISWAILFVVIASITRAQEQKCGPYSVDKAAMNKALQCEKQKEGEKLESGSTVVIRVYFRVCEPDQGLFTDLLLSKFQDE